MKAPRPEPKMRANKSPAHRRALGQRPASLARGSRGLALAARSFAAKIIAFELTDATAADLAGRWRLEIDDQERRVVQWFAPAKQAAFRAHAAICRQENEALTPYREARRVINAKLAAWHAAQMPRAAMSDPQAYSGSGTESVRADESSDAARHVEGVNFRETWRVEVIDKVAFVSAVAARPEMINLVEPNLAALSHLARAHKDSLDLPGVRVWCEHTVVASRRP